MGVFFLDYAYNDTLQFLRLARGQAFALLEDRPEERHSVILRSEATKNLDSNSSIYPQIVDSSLSRLAGSLRMTSQPKKRYPYPAISLKINRLGLTIT